MKFFDLMKRAANEAGLELTELQYEQFIKYMRLLQEWNEKINLTAITDDEEVIKKHFIDCIKAFKSDAIKNAKTIIDVGTGAGFPGLPIAIMNPNVKVTLLDSLNKRINYLNTVVRELGLKNVTTIHSRAEDGARKPELRPVLASFRKFFHPHPFLDVQKITNITDPSVRSPKEIHRPYERSVPASESAVRLTG